jgi:hypothetical protein
MTRTNGLVSVVAVGLYLFSTLPTPASAYAPFKFDSAPGRLPKDVVPSGYRIGIAVLRMFEAYLGADTFPDGP